MSTLVLDDDPTGTQSASGVDVLLDPESSDLEDVIRAGGDAYLLTNTRAFTEGEAVRLLTAIRNRTERAAREAGTEVRYVLRGDSTLRGHVFAEAELFLPEDGVIVFVPAFPAGGRVTRQGQHLLIVDGVITPAHETEYASDPVFPFDTSDLVEYVHRKSGREARSLPLDVVRDARALVEAIISAPAGCVVLPDVDDDDDIQRIARAIEQARASRPVVVRAGAPLAAALVGATSRGLLRADALRPVAPVLVVCGSHTAGATVQLSILASTFGEPLELAVDAALADPDAEGRRVAALALERLRANGLATVTTPRERLAEHHTLDHGARVMRALTVAVAALEPHVAGVVSKGGITSADVARHGLGATRGLVVGQLLTGVSVMELRTRSHERPVQYVIVPGNVGGPDTLGMVVDALLATDTEHSQLDRIDEGAGRR